jgi:hypothetical protein
LLAARKFGGYICACHKQFLSNTIIVADFSWAMTEVYIMPQDDMGVMNEGWGICGFTSSLYALYEHNPTERVNLAKGGSTGTRVLAEIKTYLRTLQAEGETGLLGEIEAFTKTFGGIFTGFTVEGYIASINDVVVTGANPRDAKYSIAMPPRAVVDYLKRICDFTNARLVGPGSGMSELILGVCRSGPGMYNNLRHYLYLLNGIIYSWGKQFRGSDLSDSVAKAAAHVGATWTIGHEIAIA